MDCRRSAGRCQWLRSFHDIDYTPRKSKKSGSYSGRRCSPLLFGRWKGLVDEMRDDHSHRTGMSKPSKQHPQYCVAHLHSALGCRCFLRAPKSEAQTVVRSRYSVNWRKTVSRKGNRSGAKIHLQRVKVFEIRSELACRGVSLGFGDILNQKSNVHRPV